MGIFLSGLRDCLRGYLQSDLRRSYVRFVICLFTLTMGSISMGQSSEVLDSARELEVLLSSPSLRAKMRTADAFDAVLRTERGFDFILGDCTITATRKRAESGNMFEIGPLLCR